MDLRQQILDAPRALRETFEKGRPEYESLVRRVRWGEGPVFMVGSGSSFHAALTAAYAFEGLLGWPVMARPAASFEAYSTPHLRPRSVLLAFSRSGETAETLDAVRAARARGAVVLGMTCNAASALAKTADLVFPIRAADAESLQADLCVHAAAGFLGLVAARILKRHDHQLDVLVEEFANLPGHMEWIQAQLPAAIRALAAEFESIAQLFIVGGGFYHPIALQAAHSLRAVSRRSADAFDGGELQEGDLPVSAEGAAILFLSGTHCRIKKRIHVLAQHAKRAGLKVFSVTDSNDRSLAEASTLSLLLPELSEMVGSTLVLALLQSVVSPWRAKSDQARSGGKRS
jgi:glucosamine--fructose-6-phosphate aminotransferase (isomerizing)